MSRTTWFGYRNGKVFGVPEHNGRSAATFCKRPTVDDFFSLLWALGDRRRPWRPIGIDHYALAPLDTLIRDRRKVEDGPRHLNDRHDLPASPECKDGYIIAPINSGPYDSWIARKHRRQLRGRRVRSDHSDTVPVGAQPS
jgi:hypothetical protein